MNLPSWATLATEGQHAGKVIVEADTVYPLFLEALGWKDKSLNQADLEVVRRLFTRYLRDYVVPSTDMLTLRIEGGSRVFALKNYPLPDRAAGNEHIALLNKLMQDHKVPA